MTNQEAYEKVRAHFSRPDTVFGLDPLTDECVYRADCDAYSPVKCSIGVLIPDELYESWFENESIFTLIHTLRLVVTELMGCDEYWLANMQRLHDRTAQNALMSLEEKKEHFIKELDELWAKYNRDRELRRI